MPQSKRHPARRPQQRPARPSHRNPAKAAQAPERVPATGWRASLERASVGPLMVVSSLPGWLIPVVLGVLLVAGLALPFAWAGILLLVPAVFLGWLLLLSWPVIGSGGRILRFAAVVMLLVATYYKLTGRF